MVQRFPVLHLFSSTFYCSNTLTLRSTSFAWDQAALLPVVRLPGLPFSEHSKLRFPSWIRSLAISSHVTTFFVQNSTIYPVLSHPEDLPIDAVASRYHLTFLFFPQLFKPSLNIYCSKCFTVF